MHYLIVLILHLAPVTVAPQVSTGYQQSVILTGDFLVPLRQEFRERSTCWRKAVEIERSMRTMNSEGVPKNVEVVCRAVDESQGATQEEK